MMRLIDQPTGTGDVYENGQFRGPVHYSLNVYHQYDDGRDEAVIGVQHIEGRITPTGTIDMRGLWSRGEGGMGQVYRATDTTPGRQVAIKILPDTFASDPERLARFERETKTFASLNHPHIAAIYGFEKSAVDRAQLRSLPLKSEKPNSAESLDPSPDSCVPQ